jgi:hypothetical protein
VLVIRQAQMHALGSDVQGRFEAELCDVFVRAYPRECRQAGGPAAMLRWVATGTRNSLANGYTSRHEVAVWLSLMLILGVDFADDPQLPWVRELLDPAVEPDPAQRLDLLFEHTLDYLGRTAGENAELMVRALLRMRAIEFASLPALEDEAAVDDWCQRLRALYPQKFAFQGYALTAVNVACQRLRARELGLRGPGGEFLFVLLSFMLGSGFDHDPLHGWAGAILHPAPAHDEDGDRAARLEAAARGHLEMSLASS